MSAQSYDYHFPTRTYGLYGYNPLDSLRGLPLSKREREIFSLLIDGKATKEIARDLEISWRTVSNTIIRMRAKYDARSTVHLVAKVLQQ